MNNSTITHTFAMGIRLSAAAALLALLTGLLALAQPARADGVVTNTSDCGPGSLRQAITDANLNPGPDTITFAVATDGNPIILSGTVGEDANAGGDLDILGAGGDLTIQGNDPSNTIIDGGGIDRVFHICPAGGCTNTVTFTGVTIRNGSADIGGGVYNKAGTTIVDSSTVSANTAMWGGGILNSHTLTIQNGSTVGGTGAGNTATINGGGIYNDTGTTTVDGSTVSANTAYWRGGGIINYSTLTIQNGSTIGGAGAGNTATRNGGGILNWSGATTIDGSTVSANTATSDGGGIYNKDTLIIQNGSTIGGVGAGNTATNDGGGIYNEAGTTTVDGSTVSANTTINSGGGIYNRDALNVQNGSTVGGAGVGNTATRNGGGILNWSGTTTIDGSTVSANTSNSYGGGIYNRDTLNVQNGSTVGGTGAGNRATRNGGGIRNLTGTTTVDGSTISANTADWVGGGIANSDTLTIQNGSTVSANTSGDAGGGIYNEGGTTTVDGSTVSANTAEDGGGIFNWWGTTTVTGSRILNNTAPTNGGGVYSSGIADGATNVTGSCIVGNSAMSYFNNEPAQQIATANWWGAATGPNTPGADTYAGNVDVTGHLLAPILGCAPELQVSKANNTGGNGTVGTPFHWTLTVSNSGLISATFDALQTILIDDLPAGPTYGVPVVGSFVDVANSDNIQCSLASNTVTCTAATGDVTLGPTAGSFEVTLPVTPSAPVTLVNPAGICRVDPDGNLTENDESNNDCPPNVVNVLDAPELQVGKANDTSGNGTVGTPFHWALAVRNSGPTSATFNALQTILIDELPEGPTYGTPVVGSFVDVTNSANIQCSLASNTLTCTAAGADVTLGATTGSFEVTIPVTPVTPGSLTNPEGICKVDPDGNVTENDESDNDCPVNTVDVLGSTKYLYLPVVLK